MRAYAAHTRLNGHFMRAELVYPKLAFIRSITAYTSPNTTQFPVKIIFAFHGLGANRVQNAQIPVPYAEHCISLKLDESVLPL